MSQGAPLEPVELPPDACGHVRITGSTEWVCVRPEHPDPPSYRSPQGYIAGLFLLSEQHWMVNRYPNRARAQAV